MCIQTQFFCLNYLFYMVTIFNGKIYFVSFAFIDLVNNIYI